MTAISHPPFDLQSDLPTGRLAIEASAGTGKTYALAALATRFVAETDVTIGELLVVTFTRAATTELRSRVRDRLRDAAAHLAHDDPPPTDDQVLTHLAAADVARRRARLARAITDFDAATISTIHGFAAQVLSTIGAASGTDADLALVDDGNDLVRELCADVLAGASVAGHADLPRLSTLTGQVITALNTPDLVILPDPEQDGATDTERLLAQLVGQAVRAVHRHRRRNGSRGFADVLTDLRDALRRPGTAPAAIAALRSRYRVALIDEFQDTDPVQWEIFSTLFTDEATSSAQRADQSVDDAHQPEAGSAAPSAPLPLVLVGDPKQAIYAFRGANVHTYVHAVGAPGGSVRSLTTNYRSDGAAVEAVDTLLTGLTFGSDAIAFAPVTAAGEHQDRRLTDEHGQSLPALSIRLAIGSDLKRNKDGTVAVPDAGPAVGADLVTHVRHLLDHAHLPSEGGAPGVGAQVKPSDIAVLVRTYTEATDVQRRLAEQAIPALLARGGSVLSSDAAEQWRWLLEALARPSDPARARTFALSWFGGRDAGWVASCSDEALARLQDQLRTWADALGTGGVTALLRRVWSESGVTARVLTRPDGDRCVTDLDHLAELFRTRLPGGRTSVAALLALLDVEPEDDPDLEVEGNLASRRVESEADAVQILTVWVAKGLEFPITLCPGLWRTPTSRPVIYEDAERGGRAFDLAGGKSWPTRAEAKLRGEAAAAEARGEDLRLLYVALTRARHQTVIWWVPAKGSHAGALTRILFGRDDDGRVAQPLVEGSIAVPADPLAALERMAALSPPGVIAVGAHGRVVMPAGRWDPVDQGAPTQPLSVAALGRRLDRTRHRWSFTAISGRAATDGHDPLAALVDGTHADAAASGADEQLPSSGDDADDTTPLPLPLPSPASASASASGPFAMAVPAPVDDSGQGRLFDDDAAIDEAVPASATLDTATLGVAALGVAAGSPLAPLPASAEVGTLVHEILEQVDFSGADLRHRLRDELGRQLSWRRLDLTPVGPTGRPEPPTAEQGRSLLVDGLEAALTTPLGPMFDHRSLASFTAADRLVELGFELRLGEGGQVATDRDIGRLLLDHLVADDPFQPWAQQVADGLFGVDLAGHLNGSIDLILRIGTRDGPPRFAVLDYKTNRLHDRGAPPERPHYAPSSMAEAMAHHQYPLQALLYAVALHRYLRWRQPGYDPAIHLAGATYLFLRGMAGPDTPVTDGQPDGVCAWPLPPTLVVALSDLLHGGRP